MIRELIAERNQSVYAVAKAAGIPYTTLNELVNNKKNLGDCSMKTIAALAVYFNVPIDFLYKDILCTSQNIIKPVTVSQSWQENRYKQYRFPIIKSAESYDAAMIHPLKQQAVFTLTQALKDEGRIEEMILYGSSTTIRCNNKSDIDLAIRLRSEYRDAETVNTVSERIQELCDWNADIVWLHRIKNDSKLFKNIERGVRVI